MAEKLHLARPFLVLLGLVGGGRWALGFAGIPYERGTLMFSVVTLTIFSTLYYGAFTRQWRGYSLMQAAVLGSTLSVCAQIFVVVSTLVSYALSLQTYFNHPTALNSPVPLDLVGALAIRLGGLVTNAIAGGIVGCLGWVLGGLFPRDQRPA